MMGAGEGSAAWIAMVGTDSAAGGPFSMKAKISVLVILPSRPVPVTCARSTPCSRAIRRTSGEDRRRSPSDSGAADASAGLGSASCHLRHRRCRNRHARQLHALPSVPPLRPLCWTGIGGRRRRFTLGANESDNRIDRNRLPFVHLDLRQYAGRRATGSPYRPCPSRSRREVRLFRHVHPPACTTW